MAISRSDKGHPLDNRKIGAVKAVFLLQSGCPFSVCSSSMKHANRGNTHIYISEVRSPSIVLLLYIYCKQHLFGGTERDDVHSAIVRYRQLDDLIQANRHILFLIGAVQEVSEKRLLAALFHTRRTVEKKNGRNIYENGSLPSSNMPIGHRLFRT